jgi:hypothetical protein
MEQAPQIDLTETGGSLNSFDIDDWIMRNKPTSLPPTITLCNYWTPLASQVEALGARSTPTSS